MSSSQKNDQHHSQSSDPILQIEAEQNHLLALCDKLEKIADHLPDNQYALGFEAVAHELRSQLPLLHQHVERALFPLLEKRAQPQDHLEEIIEGFAHEHAMDEGYVLGVLDVLDRFAAGRLALLENAENFEAAGYQLRGFFEALRRHLRWQRFIVLRLARQRLTDEDLVELADQMSIEES